MEPSPEEAVEGSILIKVLAAVLDRLVKSNASIARSDPGQVTKFHALKAPGICVEAYLERYVLMVLFCSIILFSKPRSCFTEVEKSLSSNIVNYSCVYHPLVLFSFIECTNMHLAPLSLSRSGTLHMCTSV